LAHLALPLVGEGEAWVDGRRLDGAAALAEVGLEPVSLEAKEGLSLVNGTQFMTAFGALALARARRLVRAADIACSLSVEALQGSRTSFLPQIHAARPLRGQIDSAANLLQLLEGSAINESHRWCDKVQEAHVSLGCALGWKAWQVLANGVRVLAIELLSGARAVEFLAPLEPGAGARAARDAVRVLSPRLADDRPLASDIEAVAGALRDGSLVAAVEAEVGDLR